MRCKFHLLVALFVSAVCSGQISKQKADSLFTLLESHTAKDTTRVNLLISYVKSSYLVVQDTSLFQYANEALQISEDLDWPKGIAFAYQVRGVIYSQVALDNVNALACYQQALKANERAHIKNFSWQTQANIGLVYLNNKFFRKAVDYYSLALAQARKENVLEKELMPLYLNAAHPYAELKLFDSALYFYEKAIALQDESSNPAYVLATYGGAGFSYSQTKQFAKGKEYLEKSLEMSKQNDFAYGAALALNNLAHLYLQLGNNLKAEEYAKESLAYMEQTPDRDKVAIALQTLSSSYRNQGKYKEAYDTYNRSYQIIDSNINSVTDEKLFFMGAQYEYEKKEAVLQATHSAELKQQQTIQYAVMGGAAALLVGGFLSFFFYKRNRDSQVRKKEAELKAEIADTELKVMRLQMNPHFIFNSLNSIGDYIAKNNPQEADDYLSKFAKVMRMTLENSEQRAIPLSDDLKALDLYMQLEAKRLNNKFTYEIKVAQDIDPDNTLVPPMIFQPFIENSIWHGIAKKEGQGHIIIDIRKEGEMLNCRIEDDGIGRKMAGSAKLQQGDKKQSLGMKITKARIEILNKLKGSNATVELIDKLQGVRAELKLPVETNF